MTGELRELARDLRVLWERLDKGGWNPRGTAKVAKAADVLESLAASSSAAQPAGEWEAHDGMVTVYDDAGRYLGCMGVERWRRLVVEDYECGAGRGSDTTGAGARSPARHLQDATEGVESLTPYADWRMPQGRGSYAAVVPVSKSGAACGRGEPRHERGINGGTDTSSASGRAAVPHSAAAAAARPERKS